MSSESERPRAYAAHEIEYGRLEAERIGSWGERDGEAIDRDTRRCLEDFLSQP
jgi:hypothetical protein